MRLSIVSLFFPLLLPPCFCFFLFAFRFLFSCPGPIGILCTCFCAVCVRRWRRHHILRTCPSAADARRVLGYSRSLCNRFGAAGARTCHTPSSLCQFRRVRCRHRLCTFSAAVDARRCCYRHIVYNRYQIICISPAPANRTNHIANCMPSLRKRSSYKNGVGW